MNIKILQTLRGDHEKKIEIYKYKICNEISRNKHSSDVYFNTGQYINEIINNAYALGNIDRDIDDKINRDPLGAE